METLLAVPAGEHPEGGLLRGGPTMMDSLPLEALFAPSLLSFDGAFFMGLLLRICHLRVEWVVIGQCFIMLLFCTT